jgi:hypothetical protein
MIAAPASRERIATLEQRHSSQVHDEIAPRPEDGTPLRLAHAWPVRTTRRSAAGWAMIVHS